MYVCMYVCMYSVCMCYYILNFLRFNQGSTRSLLHLAAMSGHTSVANLVLDRGIKISAKDSVSIIINSKKQKEEEKEK